MKALLLIAHGSRRSVSNDEVSEQALKLQAYLAASSVSAGFTLFGHAFLELAEPDIATGVDTLVAEGAQEIVVVPYFLAAGTHVSHDIPGIVAQSRTAHPGIAIRLTDHLGASPLLTEALAVIATHDK